MDVSIPEYFLFGPGFMLLILEFVPTVCGDLFGWLGPASRALDPAVTTGAEWRALRRD